MIQPVVLTVSGKEQAFLCMDKNCLEPNNLNVEYGAIYSSSYINHQNSKLPHCYYYITHWMQAKNCCLFNYSIPATFNPIHGFELCTAAHVIPQKK